MMTSASELPKQKSLSKYVILSGVAPKGDKTISCQKSGYVSVNVLQFSTWKVLACVFPPWVCDSACLTKCGHLACAAPHNPSCPACLAAGKIKGLLTEEWPKIQC